MMNSNTVLSPHFKQQFESLRDLLQKTALLADKCKDHESALILKDRMGQLQSAALFVVVGEVKAGKSSFINALLGEHICEVDPKPCTAVVQELVYGSERSKTDLGDEWQRVRVPQEVLRDITIVDTPGTNSILKKHQTITEDYIPRSDVVIFVFSAKNPHTATAWELLTLIRKEWHRKVVFVLQQADTASPHEMATNLESVKQYAHERNVQNPQVFVLSAVRETQGTPDSGFPEFREYLRKAVESGDVWRMKAESSRDTLRKILGRLLGGLRQEENATSGDKGFYETLLSKIELRREKANSLKRLVVDSLCMTYDQLSNSLQQDFSRGLGIGTILRRSLPFVRDKDLKTWLSDLKQQFEGSTAEQIDAEARRVSRDLSSEMETMLDDITLEISHRQERKERSTLGLAEDRFDLLEQLRAKLTSLRISEIFDRPGLGDLGSLTLAGGGLAALGAVIAFTTKVIVFDITGGIIAGAGAVLLAATLLWKRSSILREFTEQLERSRADFRSRLDREISQLFDKLFLEVIHAVQEPLERLKKQEAQLTPLLEQARALSDEARQFA